MLSSEEYPNIPCEYMADMNARIEAWKKFHVENGTLVSIPLASLFIIPESNPKFVVFDPYCKKEEVYCVPVLLGWIRAGMGGCYDRLHLFSASGVVNIVISSENASMKLLSSFVLISRFRVVWTDANTVGGSRKPVVEVDCEDICILMSSLHYSVSSYENYPFINGGSYNFPKLKVSSVIKSQIYDGCCVLKEKLISSSVSVFFTVTAISPKFKSQKKEGIMNENLMQNTTCNCGFLPSNCEFDTFIIKLCSVDDDVLVFFPKSSFFQFYPLLKVGSSYVATSLRKREYFSELIIDGKKVNVRKTVLFADSHCILIDLPCFQTSFLSKQNLSFSNFLVNYAGVVTSWITNDLLVLDQKYFLYISRSDTAQVKFSIPLSNVILYNVHPYFHAQNENSKIPVLSGFVACCYSQVVPSEVNFGNSYAQVSSASNRYSVLSVFISNLDLSKACIFSAFLGQLRLKFPRDILSTSRLLSFDPESQKFNEGLLIDLFPNLCETFLRPNLVKGNQSYSKKMSYYFMNHSLFCEFNSNQPNKIEISIPYFMSIAELLMQPVLFYPTDVISNKNKTCACISKAQDIVLCGIVLISCASSNIMAFYDGSGFINCICPDIVPEMIGHCISVSKFSLRQSPLFSNFIYFQRNDIKLCGKRVILNPYFAHTIPSNLKHAKLTSQRVFKNFQVSLKVPARIFMDYDANLFFVPLKITPTNDSSFNCRVMCFISSESKFYSKEVDFVFEDKCFSLFHQLKLGLLYYFPMVGSTYICIVVNNEILSSPKVLTWKQFFKNSKKFGQNSQLHFKLPGNLSHVSASDLIFKSEISWYSKYLSEFLKDINTIQKHLSNDLRPFFLSEIFYKNSRSTCPTSGCTKHARVNFEKSFGSYICRLISVEKSDDSLTLKLADPFGILFNSKIYSPVITLKIYKNSLLNSNDFLSYLKWRFCYLYLNPGSFILICNVVLNYSIDLIPYFEAGAQSYLNIIYAPLTENAYISFLEKLSCNIRMFYPFLEYVSDSDFLIFFNYVKSKLDYGMPQRVSLLSEHITPPFNFDIRYFLFRGNIVSVSSCKLYLRCSVCKETYVPALHSGILKGNYDFILPPLSPAFSFNCKCMDCIPVKRKRKFVIEGSNIEVAGNLEFTFEDGTRSASMLMFDQEMLNYINFPPLIYQEVLRLLYECGELKYQTKPDVGIKISDDLRNYFLNRFSSAEYCQILVKIFFSKYLISKLTCGCETVQNINDYSKELCGMLPRQFCIVDYSRHMEQRKFAYGLLHELEM